MELRSRRITTMRLPEEGPPTGAGPGMGRNANGQWPGVEVQERAPGRDQPEEQPQNRRSSHQHHNDNAAPVGGVAAGRRQSYTLMGTQRRRIMWTSEMNRFVIRAYYICTSLETDMSGRPRIVDMFDEAYPQFAGRVGQNAMNARRRAIMRNNMLSRAEIDEVREEVQRELRRRSTRASDVSRRSSARFSAPTAEEERGFEAPVEAPVQNSNMPEEPRPDEQLLRDLVYHMDEAVAQFRDTDPLSRHRVPKVQYSRKLTDAVKIMNAQVLPLHLETAQYLEDLHCIVYCAAVAIARCLGLRVTPRGETFQHIPERCKPPWKRRLEKRIESKRAMIGRLIAYRNGGRSAKLCRQVAAIMEPAELRRLGAHQLTEKIDTLVQQLSVLSKRMRRYTASEKRRHHNRMFSGNEKAFYELISHEKPNYSEGLPEIDQITNFWSDIWETPVQHRTGQPWLRREEESCDEIEEMQAVVVEEEDVREATRYQRNWAAPGPDGVQNFWFKKLVAVHPKMAECFNKVLREPHTLPEFVTRGTTFLIPKDSNTTNPSKYRPITCLTSLYKTLSAIITAKVTAHCECNNFFTEEQKGCKKNTRGCKDQAIIDAVIVGQAVDNQRNLSMAYIDYMKAYDSVPHSFLLKVLKLYKIDPCVVRFLQSAMGQWSTTLQISDGKTVLRSRMLRIQRGIFQGDSFSPLWFCLSLNPLSRTLNRNGHGFKVRYGNGEHEEITHTFYIDDLKVYSDSSERLGVAINTIERVSSDIGMTLGLDKCRSVQLHKGQLVQTGGYEVYNGEMITDMVRGESYKYLGFRQLTSICHTDIKMELRDKFLSRLNCVLKSSLNAGNMVRAVNTFAISLLTFSFGVVKWSKTDLEDLERKMRKAFRESGMRHPQSALERFTLPREEGGVGVVDIQALCVDQVRQLRRYFVENSARHGVYRAVCAADRNYSALHLVQEDYSLNCNLLTVEEKIAAWKEKEVHGAHPYQLEQTHIDKAASNMWLTRGELSPVIEADMIAIQDRIMPTRNCRRYVWRQNVEDICRMCHQPPETIDHIMAGCPVLANAAYTERHNAVAKIVHQQLALQCGLLEEFVPNYRYRPDPVLENDRFKLYWDRTILTDLFIHHNRPDVMVYDKGRKKVTIIDIAVPLNRNLEETHGHKIAKYHMLAVELKDLWGLVEVPKIVPVVISTTGIVPSKLLESLKVLKMEKELPAIQKSVILSTCAIVRNFLGYDDANATLEN